MNTHLKIIYITGSMPYGSGEEFLIPEVKGMLRQGYDVLVINRSARQGLTNADAKEIVANTIARPLLSLEICAAAWCEVFRKPVQCIRILRGLFSGTNIEVLLKNLAVFPKGLWLARLATNVGAYHIHAQWGSTTATMAMTASKLSGIPWSFTGHRGDIAGNNLLEMKLRNASFVRFISFSGFEMAKAICKGTIKGQVHIIHMGVNIPPITETSSTRPDVPVILCPANLIPVKGHTYLLEAFAILQSRGVQCSLKLAGQGGLRNKLEKQVKTLHLARHVTFLGQVSHDTLLELYRKGRVNIVVLPSIDMGSNQHEGIPVGLMEAMSYGVPCVSTTTGGIPELLGNGAGILVPPRDSLAIADAIEKLLQDDRLRERTAKNGYERVREEFNVEKVVEKMASLMAASGKGHP